MTTLTSSQIFDYTTWRNRLPALAKSYRDNSPFPHAVFDSFLTEDAAHNAVRSFPEINSKEWINYVHVNERKYGKNDLETFPLFLKRLVTELNSANFVQFLAQLTGIEGLFADNELEGGGLHQSARGGYLNIHADFTAHPHHSDWQRRVNLLVYLNPDWQDTYEGHLELWDKSMKKCARRVSPLFNRAVIFNTDPDSFHGHPEPLQCPESITRKSIALYYFTKEGKHTFVRSTEYRARPGDGLKAPLIFIDKMILRFYDFIKRRLGFRDDFASSMLRGIKALKDKIRSLFPKKD